VTTAWQVIFRVWYSYPEYNLLRDYRNATFNFYPHNAELVVTNYFEVYRDFLNGKKQAVIQSKYKYHNILYHF